MSSMNLRKNLQPAKRAWKIFTTTLHTKLCSVSASKSIKKSKTRIKSITKASSSPIFRSPVNHQRKFHRTLIHRSHRLPKRSAPVYIDELLNEPLVTSKALVKGKGTTTSVAAKLANPYAINGTEKIEKVVRVDEGMSEADDMWESLQLGSPLMHGINERADEFIARIKAEMHLQEAMALQL